MPNLSRSLFEGPYITQGNYFQSLSALNKSFGSFQGSPRHASSPKMCPPPLSSFHQMPKRKTAKKNAASLRCLLLNCRSIKSKRAELEHVIEKYNPDLLLGTDSWLTPNINNGEIFPSGYTIFRKDRITSTHGGGVFQAIKNDLLVTHKQEFDSDCDVIWSQCQTPGQRSLFIGTYYNPSGNVRNLEEPYASLLKIGKKINSHNIIKYWTF